MSLAETQRARMAAQRGLKSNPGLGIFCIVANGFLLTVNDAFAKLVMENLPVGELILVRGLIASALILAYLAARGELSLLRLANRRDMLIYSLCMILASHAFLQALTLMPLADATAITFAAPIITTALAAMLLREVVGWRRWLAVGIGFLGVMVLLAPSGQGYSFAIALLPLFVAVMVSIRDIASRRLSVTDASAAILFYNTLAVALSGLCALPFEGPWVLPTWQDSLFILLAALLLAVAQYLLVEGYRLAELSMLMPFRYLSLIFATLIGFLVWGELPHWNVALGAGIITASGLFIWYRERLRRRR